MTLDYILVFFSTVVCSITFSITKCMCVTITILTGMVRTTNILTNISITNGNKTGTHKHKINFNKSILQFLPSPPSFVSTKISNFI